MSDLKNWKEKLLALHKQHNEEQECLGSSLHFDTQNFIESLLKAQKAEVLEEVWDEVSRSSTEPENEVVDLPHLHSILNSLKNERL